MRHMRSYPVYIMKDRLSEKKLIIHTDGAARGNPGPAAIGVVLKDEKGTIIAQISRRIGFTTNNQAEYHAIIAALKKAISTGATHVELKSDSELVVQQIIGSLESFKISYIPRTQNAEADALANKALDNP